MLKSILLYTRSTIGSAVSSKVKGCGFESYRVCQQLGDKIEYYSTKPPVPNFKQDMVPYTKELWKTLKDSFIAN